MQAMLAQPANPLGLHAFVTDFRRKAENLTHALAEDAFERSRGWPEQSAEADSSDWWRHTGKHGG